MDSQTVEELCKAIIKAAAVGGTVVLTPAIVAGLGFGTGGILAGSIAAKLMSMFGATWFISLLQSVGAAGFGWFGTFSWSLVGNYFGTMISSVCNVTVVFNET